MYGYDRLNDYSRSVFEAIGCSSTDAELASRVLLSADFRGIESHGIARLSGYVRLWQKERINPRPQIEITERSLSTAVVDGDSGLGLVVGPAAMQKAIKLAEKCVIILSLKNGVINKSCLNWS